MSGPPPRYDDVFAKGTAWLNDLARCDSFNPCGKCDRCKSRTLVAGDRLLSWMIGCGCILMQHDDEKPYVMDPCEAHA